MDRLACIDLPAFPLQLLLRRHPGWRDRPVAVVDRDRPQGVLLWINREARRHGVRRGMRYAAALSLADSLHAGEVAAGEITANVETVTGHLHRYSPRVEPCLDDPGVFWLDPSGFDRLYPSLAHWAGQVRKGLEDRGWQVRIAVGFGRFGSYAAAHAGVGRGCIVFSSVLEEQERVRTIPLGRLAIDTELDGRLARLGVRTVGDFLQLPPGGIRERFGEAAHRLYERAAGTVRPPLQSMAEEIPLVRTLALEHPETDVSRLLFLVKRLLDSLLGELHARYEALAACTLVFALEGAGPRTERICPAAATLDTQQLMNLVRLRLESLDLEAGVEELSVAVEGVRISPEQRNLFAVQPRRDLAEGERALARIRAEFGDDVVVRARLTEGHLPEACFSWEPLERLASPSPRAAGIPCLVRRIQQTPQPLPPRPRNDPDGWLLRGEENGNVVDLIGPYIVSGGWWRRALHREYHFAEMRSGEIYWVYYDRNRRHWFLQGRVE